MDLQLYSYSTVTQKGQVTIPKKIREKVGIDLRKKVKIEAKKGYIKIEPSLDLIDIAPLVIAPKGKNALKARKYMDSHYQRA
ncbi:hypothetical protein A3D00_00360 [Candidatus Woesebacteria bacterium RIFCSPHIGHO2_02_FULL_38_9]|uniref:SpoVT-AbrB domain-containing protein n=1 Tax=Candidatus Woesebacteria bacterium RIFCSPHIGHO2_01_FULL_39_28 TaxID=1802496 RepID=A0A1F7YK17_9BACT|nr:MAG: hypothetical protein A2627_04615 [Candidatus Woesebacteria bacterium RIFCSPHIGHO2_01_FULL_39_28]OGM33185.1 MAG: hypothetical protein A3D00_00360 [Candidatus Woesebacteria bacterium RIFCSPHIGHO2_02_FULL_38_9]OGM57073.1 MAG: hypothetical protein A3A50_05420 [Candidatus Woesebacteria bacterium RIFCSPLOWO2_01_FULL_38_20]